MKATGIIRHIDDLGRVVIPKEIRRSMRIREDDPLECFLHEDGGVVFKKYSAFNDLSDAVDVAMSIFRRYGIKNVAIYDRDIKLRGLGIFPDRTMGWDEHSGSEYVHDDDICYSIKPILSEGNTYGFIIVPKCKKGLEAATAVLYYLAAMLET